MSLSLIGQTPCFNPSIRANSSSENQSLRKLPLVEAAVLNLSKNKRVKVEVEVEVIAIAKEKAQSQKIRTSKEEDHQLLKVKVNRKLLILKKNSLQDKDLKVTLARKVLAQSRQKKYLRVLLFLKIKIKNQEVNPQKKHKESHNLSRKVKVRAKRESQRF